MKVFGHDDKEIPRCQRRYIDSWPTNIKQKDYAFNEDVAICWKSNREE